MAKRELDKHSAETRSEVLAASGCGSADSQMGDDRKAVAVDPDTKAANLRRLRRLEGQIRGLQKMVEEDRYCPDIMIQISAAQEALRTVGRELMRNHLRHCVAKAATDGPVGRANAMYDELLELIYKHSR
jgi:CsoR family transcriptional regulator, copper-sensing transcriptional repressor